MQKIQEIKERGQEGDRKWTNCLRFGAVCHVNVWICPSLCIPVSLISNLLVGIFMQVWG